MVIQQIPAPDLTRTQLLTPGCRPYVPEAMAPAAHFVAGFTSAAAGFSPTSILIELFGTLAGPSTAAPITSGILLGLTGSTPGRLSAEQAESILTTIEATKTIQLNGAIKVPFIPSEHLILAASQPDGMRLTAYHCVHPFETRHYSATFNPLSFTEC